jgi:hypothetical protein
MLNTEHAYWHAYLSITDTAHCNKNIHVIYAKGIDLVGT